MRNYIKSSVKVVETTKEDAGFYFWLKSRERIIKGKDGNPLHIKYNGLDALPEEFYVGNELVNKKDYYLKINDMNLQYNNFPTYILEIQGSILFRDILFNYNKIGQWSESLRFLHSINNNFDESNYPISYEYKDIPEWENQFTKFMKKIEETKVTDENRLEMPYSMSSKYWICINYKSLINFLSMLKLDMPFFYKIYGRKIMNALEISELELKPYIDASLSQYYNDQSDWSEGSISNSGIYIVNSRMGLVMYSQFLRQTDTIISGFYNELSHKDPEEFKHKVFYGSTVLNVTYCAHKDKVLRTVSNRLCNFAMNSGNEVTSWSYFLNQFLDHVDDLNKFRNLLPCKFDETGCLKKCVFWNDVEFRNQGLEKQNVTCPLTTLLMSDAQKKKDRDKNKIGDLFYELTEDIRNKGGIAYKHKIE